MKPLTVAEMIEALQRLPPDAVCCFYDGEWSQYRQINRVDAEIAGIRYNGPGDTYPVWEEYYETDKRQVKTVAIAHFKSLYYVE